MTGGVGLVSAVMRATGAALGGERRAGLDLRREITVRTERARVDDLGPRLLRLEIEAHEGEVNVGPGRSARPVVARRESQNARRSPSDALSGSG